jgi:hypothetical protein
VKLFAPALGIQETGWKKHGKEPETVRQGGRMA